MNHDELIRSLIQYVAAGKLDPRIVQPVLQKLGAAEPAPAASGELLEALSGLPDPETAALADHLRENRRREALAVQGYKSRGQPVPEFLRESLRDLPLTGPLGWGPRDSAYTRVQAALRIIADRFFFLPHREKAPVLAAELEQGYQAALDAAFQNAAAWGHATLQDLLREAAKTAGETPDLQRALAQLGEAVDRRGSEAAEAAERALSHPDEPLPAGLDEDLFLEKAKTWIRQAQTPEERRRLLDLICLWPNDRVAPVLAELDLEPWARDRATMLLTLRFGHGTHATWDSWQRWIKGQLGLKAVAGDGSRVIVRKRPLAMLYLWYSRQPGRDSDLLAQLERLVAARLDPVTMDAFVERWAKSMPPEEWRALTGEEIEILEVKTVEPPKPVAAPVRPKVTEVKPRVVVPRPPPKPSVWDVHLKPFFLENWYLVAGVMMILVGSSLLAYYTWDKSPLARYTLMPVLLGSFTMGLAWMGGWIERRDAQFKATAAVLRGTAIGLLPVNFMAIALLANDDKVGSKALFVPLMVAVYLTVFGWGLRKWCAGVHEKIGLLLGGTLLFLNSLVAVVPLASLLGESPVRPIVGTGFYLGFFAMAAAVLGFARSVLTVDLSKEKRVVWFFGATLAVTFVQVFAWVHGYLKQLPHVSTYAPMMVLTGGLVLFLERKTLELRGQSEKHGAESFLGFAFILLGVLMGIASPNLRIATFILAGVVWIVCTLGRKDPLHAWIGLTLVTLGGASVGLLPHFPRPWMPSLGIALALGLGMTGLLVRASDLLRPAAAGMQAAVLIATALGTMLLQARFHTEPKLAAGHLVAVAALFGVRAWRDQKIRWAQTAMVVLALALPYVANLDLDRQILHSTSLVGSLAVLGLIWIAATLVVKSPVLIGARSTVLWIYGAFSIALMVARATLDDSAIKDLIWLDLGGPLLMCGVLVWAAWFSRSLIPSGMAMLIGLILLPEFKERMQLEFPNLKWGSGLGSAISAVVLTLVSFRLRLLPALQSLGEGDKYLGKYPYPLLRRDFTLFTWPMIASAFFLTVKVETWNFVRNVDGGLSLFASLAVLVSGVAWLLLAVYHRSHRLARGATALGLIWVMIGTGVVYPHFDESIQVFLAIGLAVQGLFFLFRFGVEPRAAWAKNLLTTPTRLLLKIMSVVYALGCMGWTLLELVFSRGGSAAEIYPLTGFTALLLVWHALTARRKRYGAMLFLLDLVVLVAWATRQQLPEGPALAALGFVIAIQVLQAALEHRKPWYEFLKPILLPFQTLGTIVVCLCAYYVLSLTDDGAQSPVSAATVVALLLTARALSSGPIALLAAAVGYCWLHADLATQRPVLLVLAEPWHVSLLALALAIFGDLGKRIHRLHPRALSGLFTPDSMKWPVAPWMFYPALGLSLLVGFYQIPVHEWPREPQVWAPYLSAITVGLVAFSTGQLLLYHVSGAFLSLGNIHAILTFWGPALEKQGLSAVHLVALGIAAALLQGSLIKRIVHKYEIVRLINQSSLAWAGLVLLLISANYLVHPNLNTITAARFAISGAMSLIAGLYFRRAARRPLPGEEPFAVYGEGLYHFGVTMTFWCAALMIPALRTPITALVALGVPVLYFYARAEFGWRRHTETFERYRASAATLGFVVLALYSLRRFVEMAVYPDVPFNTTYYHANSPVIIVLGLILLRLQALGGTSWLSFYGGLAVMGGSYFALTAIPGLSPFTNPVPSAWAAIALVHFYTLASLQRSPLRTAIQRLAAIDGNQWQDLRRPWGVCLLVAAHAMALWGCLDHSTHPRMVAPLILGAASVLVHQGFLRQSRIYYWLAQVEVLAALHAGFLVPSYLPRVHVVWALLAIWAGVLAIEPWLRRATSWKAGIHLSILAKLVLAHILLLHGPSSPVGLWAFALGSVLLALTPTATREPSFLMIGAALLPFTPAWLVWFSQGKFLAPSESAWQPLITAASVYAVGLVALFLNRGGTDAYLQVARLRPRLYDQSIVWMGVLGRSIHSTLLGLTFLATAVLQGLHWGQAFSARELVLIEALYSAFAVSAFFEGMTRKRMQPFFMAQFCVLAAFLVGRQQMLLTNHAWPHQYDVWASLGAFFACVGARQLLEKQPRELLIPLKSMLLVLPAFSVTWIFLHHLGTNLGLLVIGLHSAAFTYMGKDDRESPYHLVAIGGFISFVVLLFASTLQLTMVYAYVIPVGIGVLVLLQLFKQRVPMEARNGVRTVVLLAMLASAGWSALLDPKVPLLHNLAVIGICLAAMALGSFLHIRMYAALGFGALMVDLVVIFVKAVALLERTARMTIVGSSVLLLGASLVFGAIYYKTHKKEIGAVLDRWRLRFSGWE